MVIIGDRYTGCDEDDDDDDVWKMDNIERVVLSK